MSNRSVSGPHTAPVMPLGGSGNGVYGLSVVGGASMLVAAGPGPSAPPCNVAAQSEAAALYQHIHDVANKRISTLDYLRKAHGGRVFWFNTLLFEKSDLARMPYFDSRRLARRATNYLLLGLSLTAMTDLNSGSALELLRSLILLLGEFDAFQQIHNETGTSSAGSLTRARIPHMFRRAGAGSKSRRTSSAAELGPPDNNSNSNDDHHLPPPGSSTTTTATATMMATTNASSVEAASSGSLAAGAASLEGATNFASSETDLLPGEEYSHLLTPNLPFDPDFFETFATLCDVLIDTYARVLILVPTPRECTSGVAELFAKADGRMRKIIVQGAVKEFEDASRLGTKVEVASVGKVVLGGLM